MFRKPKSNFRSQRQIIDSDEEDMKENSNCEDDEPKLSLLEKCVESDDENGQLTQTRNLITKFKDAKLDKKKKRSNKLAIKKDCTSLKTSYAEINLSFEEKLEEAREAIAVSSGADVSNERSPCQGDEDNEIHDSMQKLLLVDCASTKPGIKTVHETDGTVGSGGNFAKEKYYAMHQDQFIPVPSELPQVSPALHLLTFQREVCPRLTTQGRYLLGHQARSAHPNYCHRLSHLLRQCGL